MQTTKNTEGQIRTQMMEMFNQDILEQHITNGRTSLDPSIEKYHRVMLIFFKNVNVDLGKLGILFPEWTSFTRSGVRADFHRYWSLARLALALDSGSCKASAGELEKYAKTCDAFTEALQKGHKANSIEEWAESENPHLLKTLIF